MLLGTWNILTLYRAGSLEVLCKTGQQYKYHIVALQETRWHGKGVMDTKTHRIFYSAKEKGTHEAGVAFLVDKKMNRIYWSLTQSMRIYVLLELIQVLQSLYNKCSWPSRGKG
jgi:exonuclease III